MFRDKPIKVTINEHDLKVHSDIERSILAF
uniref:Uncharacterized protein n=1 Tax=Tetranychus urticae TaxID=32264 RepID=T1KQX6_TETUR